MPPLIQYAYLHYFGISTDNMESRELQSTEELFALYDELTTFWLKYNTKDKQ